MKKQHWIRGAYLCLILIGVINILGQWARNESSPGLIFVDALLIFFGAFFYARAKYKKH
jgi:hypothetical protein